MAHDYADGGDLGLPKDDDKAVELHLRAVELGSAEASFVVALRHAEEESIGQVHPKYMKYLKLAAKRGHVQARYDLGLQEHNQDNFHLAFKHWKIAAAAGHGESLKRIGHLYRHKGATKDQYEDTLRAHLKAKKEISNDERKMAKKIKDAGANGFSVLCEAEFAALCGVRVTERALFSQIYRTYTGNLEGGILR